MKNVLAETSSGHARARCKRKLSRNRQTSPLSEEQIDLMESIRPSGQRWFHGEKNSARQKPARRKPSSSRAFLNLPEYFKFHPGDFKFYPAATPAATLNPEVAGRGLGSKSLGRSVGSHVEFPNTSTRPDANRPVHNRTARMPLGRASRTVSACRARVRFRVAAHFARHLCESTLRSHLASGPTEYALQACARGCAKS